MLSDPVIISLVGALSAIVSAYFSYKAKIQSEKTEKNTNHMKDELVALTAKSSHAEGHAEGVQDQKDAEDRLS